MRKFFLSFFVFIASAGYVVYQYAGGSSVSATALPGGTQKNTQVVATSAGGATQTQPAKPALQTSSQKSSPTPTPASTPAPKPKGQYADGTYTGAAADAYYGIVQIQVVIQSGKLVAVDFLQYPSDRRTSQYINDQAMPLLKQEAISAQSTSVSGVSGASDTSQAFIQSLGDALAQAKNA
jgi:uncharacterized protein with FMN-binding domain